MFNANMDPNARIPRNALCVWQSNETIARLSGTELTKSLRLNIPQSPHIMHPADWGDPCHQTLVNDQLARFERLTPAERGMGESRNTR